MEEPSAAPLTSELNPLRVDWIPTGAVPLAAGWVGRLGLTFLPGKHGHGLAGHHRRDLDADIARLSEVLDVQVLVVLVQDAELVRSGTTDIARVAVGHGLELLRFPIEDGGVPQDLAAFRGLLSTVIEQLADGRNVAVACMGGLGRTGTVVACLLRIAGLDAQAAIDLTRSVRRDALENSTQEDFVAGNWYPRKSVTGSC